MNTDLVMNEKVPEAKPGIRRGNEFDSSISKPSAEKSQPSGPDYETLKKDLEQLRDDVTKIASVYTSEKQVTLKQFTDDVVKQAQSLFAHAKIRSEELVKTASDSSKQATAQMEAKIQQKPFLSLLVSFLMGMMLAKIMDRD